MFNVTGDFTITFSGLLVVLVGFFLALGFDLYRYVRTTLERLFDWAARTESKKGGAQ